MMAVLYDLFFVVTSICFEVTRNVLMLKTSQYFMFYIYEPGGYHDSFTEKIIMLLQILVNSHGNINGQW